MEFAYNAAQRLSTRKKLLQSCWTNFELFLPLDGSKDGEESTSHAQGYKPVRHSSKEKVDK